jgi:hypothetical protein
MNIFFLDVDPKQSVKYYFNRHCVKIILEICQMLYTAHWICHPEFVEQHLSQTNLKPYRKTHFNHPTAKWVRRSRHNYYYTCLMAVELCREYTKRYGKVHKCQARVKWLCHNIITQPDRTPYKETTYFATINVPLGCTRVPLAMPEKYYNQDLIKSYRQYYLDAKQHIPTSKEENALETLKTIWK